MLLYSQRDPRWRALELGASGRTLGQIGCLVTAIAMLSTYFKPDLAPPDVVYRANFTSGGLLIWASLHFSGFAFYRRAYTREDAKIKQHITHPDLAVCLQVADATHWVVGTGLALFSGLYKIADPLFGDKATMARYQDSITGAAYFKRI